MATVIEGNGLVSVGGTSSTQGRVRLAEDTDNGANYIELTAPASVTSNQTITFPDETGTVITSAAAATQANQETATSTTTYVSPGRQQFHPSAAKAWLYCDVSGNIDASYNITSISDTGAGKVGVTINVDFSSANYAIVATAYYSAGVGYNRILNVDGATGAQAAGSFNIACFATDANLYDPTKYNIVCYGDQ